MLNNPLGLPILNLGSGGSKIKDSVSFDSSSQSNPDIVGSLTDILPFDNDSFDKVLLFHCIEHIEKYKHRQVLSEIWRVLKPNGTFLCSYPEFSALAKLWLEDKLLPRNQIERCIFGRQLYPGDYHVCAMDTLEFKEVLFDNGFKITEAIPEPKETFNTVIKSIKVAKPVEYEKVLYDEVWAH